MFSDYQVVSVKNTKPIRDQNMTDGAKENMTKRMHGTVRCSS